MWGFFRVIVRRKILWGYALPYHIHREMNLTKKAGSHVNWVLRQILPLHEVTSHMAFAHNINSHQDLKMLLYLEYTWLMITSNVQGAFLTYIAPLNAWIGIRVAHVAGYHNRNILKFVPLISMSFWWRRQSEKTFVARARSTQVPDKKHYCCVWAWLRKNIHDERIYAGQRRISMAYEFPYWHIMWCGRTMFEFVLASQDVFVSSSAPNWSIEEQAAHFRTSSLYSAHIVSPEWTSTLAQWLVGNKSMILFPHTWFGQQHDTLYISLLAPLKGKWFKETKHLAIPWSKGAHDGCE